VPPYSPGGGNLQAWDVQAREEAWCTEYGPAVLLLAVMFADRREIWNSVRTSPFKTECDAVLQPSSPAAGFALSLPPAITFWCDGAVPLAAGGRQSR